MSYAMEDVGTEVRVSFTGTVLSYRDGQALGAMIQVLEEPWVRHMVLDMRSVESLDHAAAGMLRFCADRARSRAVTLSLRAVADPVRERLGADLPADVALA